MREGEGGGEDFGGAERRDGGEWGIGLGEAGTGGRGEFGGWRKGRARDRVCQHQCKQRSNSWNCGNVLDSAGK